jgi:hypothetical protein
MPLVSHTLVFRFHTRVALTLGVALAIAITFVASFLNSVS